MRLYFPLIWGNHNDRPLVIRKSQSIMHEIRFPVCRSYIYIYTYAHLEGTRSQNRFHIAYVFLSVCLFFPSKTALLGEEGTARQFSVYLSQVVMCSRSRRQKSISFIKFLNFPKLDFRPRHRSDSPKHDGRGGVHSFPSDAN